jgi:hypothetical protein
MVSWGRDCRDLFLFSRTIATLLVNARQLDQGRAAKQALQASTQSWAFFSSTLFLYYEMRTEKNHQLHRRRIVVWWKGAPLRLRLCKTRSPPFCRLAGPLGEFRVQSTDPNMMVTIVSIAPGPSFQERDSTPAGAFCWKERPKNLSYCFGAEQ